MENKENKVELKVNVINQLKLLRQSTFKDILCFLDEDIQNAQRAKAKNVYIHTEDGKVIIENDGKILDNPQSLFSIAESGWDNETKETENPFGMGFFSNITVSNLIEVYSGNKHIIFNVNEMINTNNTEIKVESTNVSYDGFKLVLNNFDFNLAPRYDIRERANQLGKYIQELKIYYNNELQEKKDLTEGDDSCFQIKIEEPEFKGWISLANCWLYGDNLNIFYKGRLVKKLEDSPYIRGDIHISDKTLNLTSPDRKDIIKDEKYNTFRRTIKSYVKELCEDSLLNGDEDEIEDFANAIGYYIDKKAVKNKIKFLTLKAQEDSDYEYLKQIASAKSDNKNIENFKDFQLYIEKKNSQQSESLFNEIEVMEDVINKVPEAEGAIVHEGYTSYKEGYVEKPEIKKNETVERKGEEIINNKEPIFWMKFDEINSQEFKFNMLKHYGLKLIIARNKVEEEILKGMKESDNIFHISELIESIDVKGSLSNTTLSTKEQRALMLLDLVSRILGFNHNIFAIGDLMVTKTVEVESLHIKNEIIEDNITILRDSMNKKVYIDRSIIDLTDIDSNLNTEITLKDYKFILTNLYSIIKQSYLLCKNKSEGEILKEVLSALGNGQLQ